MPKGDPAGYLPFVRNKRANRVGFKRKRIDPAAGTGGVMGPVSKSEASSRQRRKASTNLRTAFRESLKSSRYK